MKRTLFIGLSLFFIINTILLSPNFLSMACAADDPAPCPEKNKPLPADLHDLIVKAETLGNKGEDAEQKKEHKTAKNHFGKAAALLTSYLKQHPKCPYAYVHYDVGYFLHSAGKHPQAASHLKRAVDLAPCFHEAWQLLSINAQETGDMNQAAKAMEKAASLTGNPDLTYQAALLRLEAGHQKTALKLLRSLEKKKSPKAEWLISLSNLLATFKKKVETAKAMEKAARLKKDPALMFHAAWLWLDADRPKHALPLLEALAKRKKPDVNWLLALCNTYMVLNKELKAAQTMERAVSLDPSAENRYSAGLLWLQVNRHPKALPHLIHLTQMESPKAQWFVALCQARLQAEDMPKAAEAMEQAFAISGKAEHAYQAGIIRLQLKEADKALTLLLPLADRPSPKASWFAAISNAWVQKEVYDKAAAAMEKSAHMTKKSDEYFRAAQLWLQAEAPKNALPLLLLLAEKPEPKVSWLLTLSGTHQRLDEIPEAAAAMERAAGISKKGEHYYRAAMLWQQADHRENTLKNLRLCVKLTPVEKLKQRWVIELTGMLLEDDLRGEAKAVMEKKSRLMNAALSPDLRYRGALLWLELDQPKRALPILEAICTIRPTSNKVVGKEVQNEKPKYPWLVSLVKTRVELDQYSDAQKSLDHLLNLYPAKSDAWRLAVWLAREQSDFGKAAAAMDVVVKLESAISDGISENQVKELSLYYHMAGVPVKAAEALKKALGPTPTAKELDRLKDIYLSGKRYEPALARAKAALKIEPDLDRWTSVGDIAFLLRRFDESANAYENALKMATERDAICDIRMKAGYAYLKTEALDQAARQFRLALNEIEGSEAGSGSVESAGDVENIEACLAYIDSLRQEKSLN